MPVLWALAALITIGGLLVGALGVYGFTVARHMASEGVTVTATVTEVDSGDDLTLEFTTSEGEEVTAEYYWASFDVPETGDEIEIVYDPDDVTYVLPEGSKEDYLIAIFLVVVAGGLLLGAAGCAYGAVRVRRRRT